LAVGKFGVTATGGVEAAPSEAATSVLVTAIFAAADSGAAGLVAVAGVVARTPSSAFAAAESGGGTAAAGSVWLVLGTGTSFFGDSGTAAVGEIDAALGGGDSILAVGKFGVAGLVAVAGIVVRIPSSAFAAAETGGGTTAAGVLWAVLGTGTSFFGDSGTPAFGETEAAIGGGGSILAVGKFGEAAMGGGEAAPSEAATSVLGSVWLGPCSGRPVLGGSDTVTADEVFGVALGCGDSSAGTVAAETAVPRSGLAVTDCGAAGVGGSLTWLRCPGGSASGVGAAILGGVLTGGAGGAGSSLAEPGARAMPLKSGGVVEGAVKEGIGGTTIRSFSALNSCPGAPPEICGSALPRTSLSNPSTFLCACSGNGSDSWRRRRASNSVVGDDPVASSNRLSCQRTSVSVNPLDSYTLKTRSNTDVNAPEVDFPEVPVGRQRAAIDFASVGADAGSPGLFVGETGVVAALGDAASLVALAAAALRRS
jgi:hypothetical protein